ncbi:Tox-REase-5 domain-containing protein [Mycolicibacterium aubagnense]|uniref:Tox-REase-5 domain-containing protein n=1 Tax=Mycolicibacterium aubagnense TaxID=319707 RepID=UPI001F43AD12|nr:Tox-REase-5 domain-containing protein [Mycolicibacterium aubagnense]WGI34406.1 Tox-REase-5 domain-containing protein [Mycolicibacterium aubagnense]
MRGLADALNAAAKHATSGAGDIAWAKRQVLDTIAEAEEAGFTVGQDLSVKDPSVTALMRSSQQRQQQATEHAHAIQAAVQALVAADKQVADRIRGALAPLGEFGFPEDGSNKGHDPTVRAVDYHPGDKPGDQHGGKPDQKPSGAAGPTDPLAQLLGVGDPAANKPDPNSPWTKQPAPGQPDKQPTNPLDVLAGEHDKPGSTSSPAADGAGKPTNPLDLLAGKDGKGGADPNYTHNPLLAPIVKADPSVVDQQRAKVDAAQQAVDAAQAKVDASVNQAVTSGPYNGHDLNDSNPLARELFDARHNLIEQRNLLQDMNAAAAETGGKQAPVPTIPENASVQAFAPEPSLAERAPQELADSNHTVHELTGGLVPDVANMYHVATDWGAATPAERAQAIADAAGLVPLPGMKLGAEGLEHLAGPAAEALTHGAPPVVAEHLPLGNEHAAPAHAADGPPPMEHGSIGHGSDAAPSVSADHGALSDMLLGGHHDPNPFDGPAAHTAPAPDIFDPNQGSRYTSGDSHHPGGWPPSTPEPTWTKGDADPGWKHVNHNFDKDWMPYQQQIAGVERTPEGALPEWVQHDPDTGASVDFDGHTHRGPQEVFLEAKDGFRGLAFAPDNSYWEGRAEKALGQVDRQLAALPPGAMLEWHVSDPYGAAALRKLFSDNGIDGVDVIFTPGMP